MYFSNKDNFYKMFSSYIVDFKMGFFWSFFFLIFWVLTKEFGKKIESLNRLDFFLLAMFLFAQIRTWRRVKGTGVL